MAECYQVGRHWRLRLDLQIVATRPPIHITPFVYYRYNPKAEFGAAAPYEPHELAAPLSHKPVQFQRDLSNSNSIYERTLESVIKHWSRLSHKDESLEAFASPFAMADPTFIQVLQVTQKTNYANVAVGALVAYDQALSFSQEVDFIWNRNWGFMTVLYLIARYSGSLCLIGSAVGYVYIGWTYSGIWNPNSYVNTYLAVMWATNIFLLSMQAILVIRVYALFNQSKKLLIFLATSYALQAAAVFVMTALEYNYRALHEDIVSIGPAIGSVMQSVVNSNNSPSLGFLSLDSTIVSVVFDGVLLFFALWAFEMVYQCACENIGSGSFDIFPLLNISIVLLNNILNVFNALAVVAGPRMVISLRAQESKMRGVEGDLSEEISTVQFGITKPPTQSQSVMQEGGGLQVTDENVQID
ncbi:hypothetical protein BJ138DRAFT_1097308 [Hygrophoropsis aurantiaca]|uniref:Uncharacterized protein n=1 Tax=Hygrophoropsis aurantiaca TaxID=72124 RepID=A0ACB8AUM5_9AGAM|nr:hypothetical protein BJ138DRAFT_1097308 [Hygrophoropsis aurantiaca]